MTFHIGQKVVCVDDTHDARYADYVSAWVKRGAVYTVRAITPADQFNPVGVALEGIVGELHPIWDDEYAWKASRFRPVVEDRKSVSFTIGADPDSDIWDNRKKTKEKV